MAVVGCVRFGPRHISHEGTLHYGVVRIDNAQRSRTRIGDELVRRGHSRGDVSLVGRHAHEKERGLGDRRGLAGGRYLGFEKRLSSSVRAEVSEHDERNPREAFVGVRRPTFESRSKRRGPGADHGLAGPEFDGCPELRIVVLSPAPRG